MSPVRLTDSSGSSTLRCARRNPGRSPFGGVVHTIHTPDEADLGYLLIIDDRNVRQAA